MIGTDTFMGKLFGASIPSLKITDPCRFFALVPRGEYPWREGAAYVNGHPKVYSHNAAK
jgi:hypothetical protein